MKRELTPDQLRDFRKRLLDWYRRHRRILPWRQTRDPYAIWVSEVMLQQTQVKTVIPYYRRFLGRFPDLAALAHAPLQEVLKVWEGLGYYTRVRNLHRAAQRLVRENGGALPAAYEQWKQLPGVGEYIAAAISSIAFQQPCAVVDGNVKRVLSRLFLCDEPVNRSPSSGVFGSLADQLLDRDKPGDHNQAMMELGATVCRPRRPLCPRCPVRGYCRAFREGVQGRYPVRLARTALPEVSVAVGVVHREGRVLITQRREKGLLGGLWEFPGGKIQPNESPAQACRREIHEEVGLVVEVGTRIARIKHAYSHFKVMLQVFSCRYLRGKVRLKGPVNFQWVWPEELENYPFPAANRKFLPLIQQSWERFFGPDDGPGGDE